MTCSYEREPCPREAIVILFGKGYCHKHFGFVYGGQFVVRMYEAWRVA